MLEKIKNKVFELNLLGLTVDETVPVIDKEFGKSLIKSCKPREDTSKPHFNKEMIQTLLDYANLEYLMASNRRPPKSKPMTIEEAIAQGEPINMVDEQEWL